MFLTVRIFEELIYVCLGEPERFVQMRGRDGIGDKIIGAGKNAFFGDPQTAGNNSKTEGVVVFQRLHQALHHVQHLCIVPLGAGLGNGDIVFINQKNDRFFIMCLH